MDVIVSFYRECGAGEPESEGECSGKHSSFLRSASTRTQQCWERFVTGWCAGSSISGFI